MYTFYMLNHVMCKIVDTFFFFIDFIFDVCGRLRVQILKGIHT